MNLRVDLRWQAGPFRLDAGFEAPGVGLTALHGPSGAGKSSLLRLLAGLEGAREGSVWLGDECLFDRARGIDRPPEERGIALVFQDLRLFPHLDVCANLDYGARRAAARAALLPRDRLVELLALGPLLRRRIQGLSGGERQRVALGRALLSRPRLLLLDEPFAALDAARRAELLPCFDRLRAERTLPMLMVTHQYEDVLRLADHLLLLEGGRLLASGTPLALATDPRLGARLPPEALGALVEGQVASIDAARGLATVPLGAAGELRVPADGLAAGQPVRLQLLARDLILATTEPRGLSVRNRLQARVAALEPEPGGSVRVALDAGGLRLLARITADASEELGLAPGLPVWVLVKALSLPGHIY